MRLTIRAHFDGKVVIPDVVLPRDTPLTVRVETFPVATPAPYDRQRAAYDSFLTGANARPVPHLPDHALRRQSMYED
jgi:hypothetical protein